MNDDRLLHAALQDAADTRQVVIGSGARASAAGVFKQACGDQPAIIVADENTFDVAGREVQRQLAAAHLDPIEPLMFPSVATAASRDGYTALGAAIPRAGFKQTMACPAPRAIVADVEVLIEAPAEMTAWGYADLLGIVIPAT